MTKNEIKAQLKKDYPTLKKGSNELGYEILASDEYETMIDMWADNLLEQTKQAEANTKAEADKAALLAKLGITDDEAKLLLN